MTDSSGSTESSSDGEERAAGREKITVNLTPEAAEQLAYLMREGGRNRTDAILGALKDAAILRKAAGPGADGVRRIRILTPEASIVEIFL